MQRKMTHWLIRVAFLPLNVALVVDASLAAAGYPPLAQQAPLAATTSGASGAGQVLLAQATPRTHPLGAEGRRGSVPGHFKRATASQIVVVIDRTISMAVKQGAEISFELTPQTEWRGMQGQSLSAAAVEAGSPVRVTYTVRGGQVMADRVLIQPGTPLVFENKVERPPQPVTPTRPPTPGQEQRTQESGLKQPWQTSWKAFCGELQRLFQSGATQDAMDAQFAGKPVIWEGEIIKLNESDNSLVIRMPTCRVTRPNQSAAEVRGFGADHRSLSPGALRLEFSSARELRSLGDVKLQATVRFSTVLYEKDPHEDLDDNPVAWYTEATGGKEPIEFIGVRISGRDSTKLLEYVTSQVQDPTGSIPSINAKVASLRFFENPPQGLPRERRVYGTRFVKSQVNRIFWELTLEHPAPGRRVNFLIESIWHSPTTEQSLRRTMRASLQPEWTWSYWHDGGRIITKQSEPWPVGSYRVNLYVAGAKVTSGAFEIADDPSPAPHRSSAGLRRNEELAEAAYQEAQRLKKELKLREAIPYLDKAINLNPEFIPAYELRGSLYSILLFGAGKDFPRYSQLAIADSTTAIEKTLEKGEHRPDLYRNRGELYMTLMDHRRALADFDEAIKLDPRNAATFFNRGEVRRGMGDLDGALADHTRAIELDQKTGLRYCHRGLVWLMKGQDTEAQNDFRRCYELEPSRREEYTERSKKVLEKRQQKP